MGLTSASHALQPHATLLTSSEKRSSRPTSGRCKYFASDHRCGGESLDARYALLLPRRLMPPWLSVVTRLVPHCSATNLPAAAPSTVAGHELSLCHSPVHFCTHSSRRSSAIRHQACGPGGSLGQSRIASHDEKDLLYHHCYRRDAVVR